MRFPWERLYRDGEAPEEITLTDARATYFRLHKEGGEERFQRDTNLPVDAFMALAGDRPLPSYTRDQANCYRDAMTAKGNKTATVRRRLRVLSAVFNMAKREHSLTMVNPFEGIIIARDGIDATPRLPFSLEELRTLMVACRKSDDDRRHILSIQLDTGARLSEIVGLRREDVFLTDTIPHIIIRANRALGRRVKTEVSARRVPLVGEALWGTTRAMAEAAKVKDHGEWLFPRYATDGKVKGNHASATLNKWMKTLPGVEGTTHSFRHAMRDRMREAGIPEDIRDAIDGHGTRPCGRI
ncbi:tyrosine-type recombinase/integrase [Lichenibacterium dinghuense]|uniref:tyrosine-type recombinase/integrase n=1 Tax=Lichenibacterium dinghuense TaxID=2895977 RepID=UPI001F01AEE6|nr:tyrosine-type recombinase/integrase [Lichenibacterium sp. 6Y81]